MEVSAMLADVRKQIKTSPVLGMLQGSSKLQHAVCGLTEESGEVAGLLKRQIYRHSDIPVELWVEELGDVLWYWLAVLDALGLDPDTVFEYNKEKLEARYGTVKS